MENQERISPGHAEGDEAVNLEALVQRVCASRTFKNSESLRRLLTFLARRTQESPDNTPKEYEIAVEALDRPASFDPRADSAVRVVTSRLRSKLTEYYSDEGRNDPVMIELQRGVYSLRLREAVPAAEEQHEPATEQVSSPWLRRGVLACLLVAAIAGAFQLGKRVGSTGEASGTRWTPAMSGFWRPFLSKERPTVVVIGTPLMLRAEAGGFYRDPRFNDWNEPDAGTKRRLVEERLRSPVLPSYLYTGVGEAAAAFFIAQLMAGRGQDLEFRRSSAFGWDALRNSNVVFVGAPKWNPQIIDLPFEQEFIFEEGNIINRRPRAGEPAVFEHGGTRNPISGDLVEAYALVTRFSGMPGYGAIVALSSGGTAGAWAAAEYVSRAEHLDDILGHVRTADGSWPACFQVVLHARFKALVPVVTKYVTHRVLKTGPGGVR